MQNLFKDHKLFINYILQNNYKIDNSYVYEHFNTIHVNSNIQVIENTLLFVNDSEFILLLNDKNFFFKKHNENKEVKVIQKHVKNFMFELSEIIITEKDKLTKSLIHYIPEPYESAMAFGYPITTEIIAYTTKSVPNYISFNKNDYNLREMNIRNENYTYYFYNKTENNLFYSEGFNSDKDRYFNHITLNKKNEIIEVSLYTDFKNKINNVEMEKEFIRNIKESSTNNGRVSSKNVSDFYYLLNDEENTIETAISVINKTIDINLEILKKEHLLIKNNFSNDKDITDLFYSGFFRQWVPLNDDKEKNICTYQELDFFKLGRKKDIVENLEPSFILSYIDDINNLIKKCEK